MQAFKLFFGGAFLAAGSLQAMLSSVGWLDARGWKLSLPAILTHESAALPISTAAGLLVALANERLRQRRLRNHHAK